MPSISGGASLLLEYAYLQLLLHITILLHKVSAYRDRFKHKR